MSSLDSSWLGQGFDSSSGADLSTVTPNPTITNQSQGSTMQDISQLANVAGQWGATFASIFAGNQTVSQPTGAVYSTPRSTMTSGFGTGVLGTSGTGTVLLLLAVAAVLYFALRD